MKRVLFLDDDRRRTELFRERYGSACELTTTETALDCIRILDRREFDLLLLDHDLGGEIYCDSGREDCGMEVVRWLTKRGSAPGVYVLHSYNPGAAQLMLAGLHRLGAPAYVAPFGSPDFHSIVRGVLVDRVHQPDVPKRPSLSDRFRRYLRSLRLGR